LPPFTFRELFRIFGENELKISMKYVFFIDIPIQTCYTPSKLATEDAMEDKIPENLLNLYESLLSSQLRTIRQLKNRKPLKRKPKEKKGMSNMDMAIDILQQARKPLHISEILAQIKAKHRVSLDRESLVSALVKKVHRNQGLTRTAPNTFTATLK